ncbi:hypothetical protein ND861_04745 [Leptospira sp. 2 VSF19]|uniref:Lipoprotein n=1 Tax=Leptospira soteropolitanensis TaxID=2950025 RepID=A0AAW5VE45_9LEPT|nr:hypothetical protein [Leptospira soteropolitanensis]MCW7491959.1 hypothetical protein [Leptospira soteropolitanensis]MCW7499542.1 hypothetical protein [Leptospira soteropolitanensis]MCW7520867.1 hypothetical protein [Leptospira soteropolitanensis]MCW7525646.1 hypothetical protein [Leptospira soteropolitanensis]MCW7529512.1 hypothetical protein [Leptospira soteropolitanensis]
MESKSGDISLKRIHLVMIGILTFSILNCATARVVSSKPGEGGTVALTQGILKSAEAKAEANNFMATNCGSKQVKILQEGEVVVGTTTNVNQNTNVNAQRNNSSFTKSNTNISVSTAQTSNTRNITEWQIEYACE